MKGGLKLYSGAKAGESKELSILQKSLFDRAFHARSERMSYQSREQFDDKYKIMKAHWLTVEQALIDVIEESGEMPAFERYIGLAS